MSAKITDLSNNIWPSFMGEVAEKVMGIPASLFKQKKETSTREDLIDFL